MINPEALRYLCCPIAPTRDVPLEAEELALRCTRCSARFRVRDDVPNLVAEEAELPDGCRSISDLPCRQTGGATAASPGGGPGTQTSPSR